MAFCWEPKSKRRKVFVYRLRLRETITQFISPLFLIAYSLPELLPFSLILLSEQNISQLMVAVLLLVNFKKEMAFIFLGLTSVPWSNEI